MSLKRDMKDLITWASTQGWSVGISNGTHYKLKHPTAGIVFTSFTPSDHRSILNARAMLVRKMRMTA